MTPLAIVLGAISIILSVVLIIISVRLHRSSQEILRLRSQVGVREKTEELTEFLSDVKTNGFGFVRVNPTNILYRR